MDETGNTFVGDRAVLIKTAFLVICLSLACGACSVRSDLPLGPQAYAVIPADEAAPTKYLIGPLDTVNVTVFREPQLSLSDAHVDAGGEIVLPLVGVVKASGKTAGELSAQIQAEMKRYLTDPHVSVTVESVSQTIAVEGGVNQPGVFAIPGKSSLIEALALARSPTQLAANDQVIVFRKINGQRAGARFDIRRVRMGLDPDPVIYPGDRIVVGFDALKQSWEFYFKAPIFNLFRIL